MHYIFPNEIIEIIVKYININKYNNMDNNRLNLKLHVVFPYYYTLEWLCSKSLYSYKPQKNHGNYNAILTAFATDEPYKYTNYNEKDDQIQQNVYPLTYEVFNPYKFAEGCYIHDKKRGWIVYTCAWLKYWFYLRSEDHLYTSLSKNCETKITASYFTNIDLVNIFITISIFNCYVYRMTVKNWWQFMSSYCKILTNLDRIINDVECIDRLVKFIESIDSLSDYILICDGYATKNTMYCDTIRSTLSLYIITKQNPTSKLHQHANYLVSKW